MRYLTVALTKGRLAQKTLDMFEQIGIICEEMRDKDTRKLIFVNEDLKLRFFRLLERRQKLQLKHLEAKFHLVHLLPEKIKFRLQKLR